MRALMADANHRLPGDPKKLAEALLVLADSAEPPVRLPLGTDTVAKLADENRFVEEELKKWHAVAVSTDHDQVAG